MSQVFKSLTRSSTGDKSLICKQGINSWVRQWHIKSVQSCCLSEWSASGSVSTFRKNQHVRMYHRLQNTSPCEYRWRTNAVKPINGCRNMSILTDLLGRKKNDDEDEVIPEVKTLPLFDDSPKGLTDEEIEAKRNISRLNIQHQRLVHGQPPYPEPLAWIHHTVRYKQRMFGRYGESSGVNPGLLWPTRDELKEKIEYEKICNPLTIQELVEKKRAMRQAEKEARERRIKEVEAKMAVVDKFKQDLANREAAKEREANEAKARREKLMEEVRRHFGYTVDPREEKFQELLAKKEKEQRKTMKEARKLEKEQRILQKLEGKSASAKAKSKEQSKDTGNLQEDKEDD